MGRSVRPGPTNKLPPPFSHFTSPPYVRKKTDERKNIIPLKSMHKVYDENGERRDGGGSHTLADGAAELLVPGRDGKEKPFWSPTGSFVEVASTAASCDRDVWKRVAGGHLSHGAQL